MPGQGEEGQFGQVLHNLRQRAGLTQADLSRRTGISQSLLSKLERGQRRRLRMEGVLRIGEALSLSDAKVSDLLRAAGYPVRKGKDPHTGGSSTVFFSPVPADAQESVPEAERLLRVLRLKLGDPRLDASIRGRLASEIEDFASFLLKRHTRFRSDV
jgi:transcriptional regulator with XRE-family HTH domain